MKAMSLELMRGTVDEVDEVAHIDWILPRYLSHSHLTIMVNKLKEWENKMDNVTKLVEDNSQELVLH